MIFTKWERFMCRRLSVIIILSFAILIHFPKSAVAEGFGKIEWGMSKEQVENVINSNLENSSFKISHFILYMDQIKVPSEYVSYSSKFKIFNVEFDAVFSFDNAQRLKQIVLYQEKLGDVTVITNGGDLNKKFESYFTRQYGKIYKSNSLRFDFMQYLDFQWMGNETFVHMIELIDLKPSQSQYKHAIEIMIRQEDSPF